MSRTNPTRTDPHRDALPKGDPERPRRKARRRILVALAALLVAGACVAGALLLLKPGAPGGPAIGSQPQGSFKSIGFDRIELRASDEREALEALDSISPALDLGSARDELGNAVVSELDGATYYRFPQEYRGIPVFGRSAVLATGTDGKVAAVTANTVALDAPATEPSASKQDVENAATARVQEVYPAAGDIDVEDFGDDDLTIYTLDSDGSDPVLAYRVTATFTVDGTPGVAEMLVSAEDASFLLPLGTTDDVMLPGTEGEVDVALDDYRDEDTPVPMRSTVETGDDDTVVSIYEPSDAKGEEAFYWKGLESGSFPYAEPVMTGGTENAQLQGADAMYSLTAAVDYYYDFLGRSSYDDAGADLATFVDVSVRPLDGTPEDPKGTPQEYRSNASHQSDNGISYFTVSAEGAEDGSPNPYIADPAVMAHEFTHAVVANTAELVGIDGAGKNTPARSINEGLADVIAIAVRARLGDQDGPISWQIAGRDPSNPAPYSYDGDGTQSGQISDYETFTATQEELAEGVEEHVGSTILSHYAYRIWQAWTDYADPTDRTYTDLLAKLYYQALLLMPADCTVPQMVRCVITAGDIMYANGELTGTQNRAIEEVLSEMGMPAVEVTHLLPRDAEAYVTDVNGSAYCDYNAALAGSDGSDVAVDRPENSPITAIDAESLKTGVVYRLTVSDRANSGALSVTVRLMRYDGGGDEEELEESLEGLPNNVTRIHIDTDFGQRPSYDEPEPMPAVDQDVVLALDMSSSMEGEPVEMLRDAAEEFLSVAEQSGLSVGVVLFSDEAEATQSLTATDYEAIRDQLGTWRASGSTNVEDALLDASEMLEEGDGAGKSIVLMTDGQSTVGASGDDLVEIADDIKADGTKIYTLGFFSALPQSDLAEGQDLLERIASVGEHFESTGLNLTDLFGDIAEQLSGGRYTFVRVACPVDVTVVRNGEVLSSATPEISSSTTFGSISYLEPTEDEQDERASDGEEEPDDQVKVLRLRQDVDYDIFLEGTGDGHMDYSVSFMDENGAYGDERAFEDIPIEDGMLIRTSTAQSEQTALDVDEDGDGTIDMRYRTAPGGEQTEAARDGHAGARVAVAAAGVLLVGAIVATVEYRRRMRREA